MSLTTKALSKAERTSKQPNPLPPTATPRLYQIISTRVNRTTFIFTWQGKKYLLPVSYYHC
jgi:hypothetical protein